MAEDLTKQLRSQSIALITSLYGQLYNLETDPVKKEQIKNVSIDENKPIPYYEAMIDILNKQVQNATLSKPKKIKFDATEQERANLNDEDRKTLEDQIKRQQKQADSYLATVEDRCSLKGNLAAPNSVILRYRGNSVKDPFREKYPLGVLM